MDLVTVLVTPIFPAVIAASRAPVSLGLPKFTPSKLTHIFFFDYVDFETLYVLRLHGTICALDQIERHGFFHGNRIYFVIACGVLDAVGESRR